MNTRAELELFRHCKIGCEIAGAAETITADSRWADRRDVEVLFTARRGWAHARGGPVGSVDERIVGVAVHRVAKVLRGPDGSLRRSAWRTHRLADLHRVRKTRMVRNDRRELETAEQHSGQAVAVLVPR